MKKIIIIFLSLFITSHLLAKTITVVSINDFHGQLTQKDQNPGMVKFASAIENTLKTSANPILVSAGDNYQGSTMSNLTHGAPVNEMFRRLGVVASAVGNHEFDWNIKKSIRPWEKQGHFHYVAANIYNKKTNQPVTFVKPYIIVKKDGVRIAFIGLATQETPLTTEPAGVKPYVFKDDVSSAQHWVNYLLAGKDQSGKPNAIIALTHIPSFQKNKTSKIKGHEINDFCYHIHGVNAVISAHSHQYVNGEINHIPVIQAMKYGQAIGKLTLVFNDKNQLQTIKHSVKPINISAHTLSQDHPTLLIYQHYYKKFQRKMNQQVGYAKTALTRQKTDDQASSLGQFLCHIMVQQTGADIAMINHGGIRTDLDQGKITYNDIFDMLPFDNIVMTVTLSGKSLLNIIHYGLNQKESANSTLEYYGLHIKQKTRITLLNGQPIDMKKRYKIVTLDFLLDHGDGYPFQRNASVHSTHKTLREIVINAIKKRKVI